MFFINSQLESRFLNWGATGKDALEIGRSATGCLLFFEETFSDEE